jgi:hypothetical protein
MAEDYNENLDNPGEYNSKSDFSKAEIARQQASRVNEIRSKEMREGYYNSDKFGNRIYIPDTRKEFISAVKALRTLLEPEVRRDKIYQRAEQKILGKIKEATNIFGVYEYIVNGNKVIVDTSKPKHIPHLGEIFPVGCPMVNKSGMPIRIIIRYIPGYYNRNHHDYWDYLIECYDELSGQLQDLVDRAKYFKEEISY